MRTKKADKANKSEQTNKHHRSTKRSTNESEKMDAYLDNDGQPPFDEAPVKAGGSIPDQDR